MALQVINIGSSANDRTGDPWRDAFVKVNSMLSELYAANDAQSFVFASQESDFPNQTASTITLTSNTVHITTASFTTSKNFVAEQGSVITSFNIYGPTLTYDGAGSMFSGSDVDFTCKGINLACPNANVFNMTDTVGGVKAFTCSEVRVFGCLGVGTVSNYSSTEFFNCFMQCSNGISIAGSSSRVFSLSKVAMITTSASFVGVDLGTAVLPNIEITDLICEGVSGSIGISGLANNGNVTSGFVAEVTGCSFSSLMTPLQNITTDDIRFDFKSNSGIPDTYPDALIYFNGNTTETVISTVNTPVIVNATWSEQAVSHFTSTSGGRVTHDGEREIRAPIDISAGLISAGGGAIDVSLYLAKNGSVITASKTPVSISGTDPQTLSIPWQDTAALNDYYEVFVENNTGTTNIIVEYCKLRVR